jgi:hypothetical protein
MAKLKPSTLQIRKMPSDLFGRVNAMAELLELDRDDWVKDVLRDAVKGLESVQINVKKAWDERHNKRSA